MNTELLRGSLNPKNIIDLIKYRKRFRKENPEYFYPEGLLVFCGSQGSGKTLSAVQYVKNLCIEYPRAILVTNTKIEGLPAHTAVVPYNRNRKFNFSLKWLMWCYLFYRRNSFRI